MKRRPDIFGLVTESVLSSKCFPSRVIQVLRHSFVINLAHDGYSTWRTLVPVLEDRPLALCDSRSVDPEDLIPADRIIPTRVGEVYYLKYNARHRW
jgi:hypothetical protein